MIKSGTGTTVILKQIPLNTSEKTFLSLIEQHQGILHKVCSLYTDDDEAHKDLFQEVMLQLWRGFPRFRNESKVTTWMYRVALHTAISALKKKKRSEKYLQQQQDKSKDPLEDPHLKQDNHELLHYAMNRLNTNEKALIMLYLEGKNYREIAEIIGISENNVGVRLNRVKKKLKQLMTV